MEIDECSFNSESGAEEEDEEDELSISNSDSSSNSSESSTSSDSEDSGEQQGSSSSESSTSDDEDDDSGSQPQQPQEKWEHCAVGGSKIKLPQDLCEHYSIFKEMFSYPQILQELSDCQRESVYSLLPKFPQDCNMKEELGKTIKMLFTGELKRFGVNPLKDFHDQLTNGYFRPDIKKVRNLIRKSKKRKYKFEERKRAYELLKDVLKSRENLLSTAYKQGYGQNFAFCSKSVSNKDKLLIEQRAHLRYKQELKAIKTEMFGSASLVDTDSSSDDELYKRQTLDKIRPKKSLLETVDKYSFEQMPKDCISKDVHPTSSKNDADYTDLEELTEESYREMLAEHRRRRARNEDHPELNTDGIILSDVMNRIGTKHKLCLNKPSRSLQPKKKIKIESPISTKNQKLLMEFENEIDYSSVANKNQELLLKFENEADYSNSTEELNRIIPLENDQKPILADIKIEQKMPFEMKPLASISSNVTPAKRGGKPISFANMNIKQENVLDIDMDYDHIIKSENDIIVNMDSVNSELSVVNQPELGNDLDHKEELDLDTIDMMQLPIQLDDGIDLLDSVKCEDVNIISIPEEDLDESLLETFVLNDDDLVQESCACFFSLIRNLFLSKGEYRMNRVEMKIAVTHWQENPISSLNDWFPIAPSWSGLLNSGLAFLAGELVCPHDCATANEEFVPYLENKGRGIYAWIGAGRDSDAHLSALCDKFLMYKDTLVPPKPSHTSTIVPTKQQCVQVPSTPLNNTESVSLSMVNNENMACEKSLLEKINMQNNSQEWVPPKALYPTDWKVRPSTAEEKEEFRKQERMRYAAPHKAFTYRMHGYCSVVGPVKGIYQHNAGSGLTKARGHSLLVPDRPNFVTILALVRDATARLPNGEGTRSDICQLLKDSQYIQEDIFNNDKEANLNSVVSGALDRLHYETDPCVRYYPKRKEWLYLHRARSESEFEMYHQQLQGVPKNKKNSSGSRNKQSQQASTKLININAKETTPVNTPLKDLVKKEKKLQTVGISISRKEPAKKIEEINPPIDQMPVEIHSTQIITPVTTVQNPLTKTINVQKNISVTKCLSAEKSVQIPKTITPQRNIESNHQKPIVAASKTTAKIISVPKTLSSTPATISTSIASSSILTGSLVSQPTTTFVSVSAAVPNNVDNNPTITEHKIPPVPVTTGTITMVKKVPATMNLKALGVLKSNNPQSLLQSNQQQHLAHQQIQVNTSSGLQTIRLTGHSVLQNISNPSVTNTTNVVNVVSSPAAVAFPTTKAQTLSAQTILSSQSGKSLLQTSNLKQFDTDLEHQHQQQQPQIQTTPQQQTQLAQAAQQTSSVLPGKTVLAPQCKLVGSGPFKLLSTAGGLQGQTILIKPPTASSSTTSTQSQSPQQSTSTPRLVTLPQSLTNASVQKWIAQLGGKSVAVQIQPPQQQSNQQQQQQQQKVLAKFLQGPTQLISMESLLAQKGLKLTTTTASAVNTLARQGKILQTQFQTMNQTQSNANQPKIIVTSQPQPQESQQLQPAQQIQGQTQQAQPVRMVTSIGGKPIVLTSGSKSLNVNLATSTGVMLGKQSNQPTSQPSIILPNQLLNLKTLQGLKVIPATAGLKTAGTALYARVVAPSTASSTQSTSVSQSQQPQQPNQQSTQHNQTLGQNMTGTNPGFSGSQ